MKKEIYKALSIGVTGPRIAKTVISYPFSVIRRLYPAHPVHPVLISLLIFLFSAHLYAVCTVTKTADTNDGACTAGDCSLREAVAEPSCSLIDFSLDLVEHPVNISLGDIVIDRSLTIQGYGADAITIAGNNVFRIFYIAAGGGNATIKGVKLTGGGGNGTGPGGGGAIANAFGGQLTLDGVYLTGNSSQGGAAIAGRATIRNSTIAGNTVTGTGTYDAAITGGSGYIYNSTICNNTGPAIGTDGFITILNSTIANNGPKGVIVDDLGILTPGNSIIKDIYLRPGSFSGDLESDGNNILTQAAGSSGLSLVRASDLINVEPQLGPCQNNGGHTPTMALLGISPGIDGGNNTLATNAGLTADQRGYLRFFDGDGDGTATVDIGAFEFNSTASAAPVSVSGRVLTASGQPVRSISVSITDLQGNARHAFTSSLGWFTFDQMPGKGVYKISISSKRYNAPEKVVFADQNITDADIFVTPAGESKTVR